MTTTAERPVETKQGMSAQSRRRMSSLIVGVAAWIIGLIFVTPVLYMLLTSLHSEPDAATNPPSFFAPLTFEGYANFFGSGTGTSPWPSLINSATASILSTILVLVLSIPAAYALSIRPVRKWTDVMFFFLSTKMLPVVAGLLPIYLIAQFAGMLDNVYTLVIIYTSMNLPIAVWMMRSFFLEVPGELLEAASLDGASLWRSVREVILPLVSPGIAATALICVIFAWNEFFFAVNLTAVNAQTMPVYLVGFIAGEGQYWAVLSAAATMAALPVILCGWFAQNKLVRGLSFGAIK